MRPNKNITVVLAISLLLCLLLPACSVHKTQIKGSETEAQTMSIAERWKKLRPPEWNAFAKAWIAELNTTDIDESPKTGNKVVFMNLTASPEQQWDFILISLALARTEKELAAIAAGPTEHLLGAHGEDYIERIEQQSKNNPKFSRMLSGVWGERAMTKDVHLRVEKLKEQVSAPINLESQKEAHKTRLQLEESTLELLDGERNRRIAEFFTNG